MRTIEAIQLRDAMLDHGMPAFPASIMHCLIRHSETRWRCTIGLRAIARECAMSINSVQKHLEWLDTMFVIRYDTEVKVRNQYTIQSPRTWKVEEFDKPKKRRFVKLKLIASVSNRGADAVSSHDTEVYQISKQKA